MLSFAAVGAQDPTTVAAITALLAALGLSSTAGIRAYLPLFAVGLASHANVLHLQSQFRALGAAGPLVILGVLMVGEFFVDKIPVIDHLSDFAHTFIRPLSGAAIMAGTQNSLSDKSGLAAAVIGGALALVFHGAKSATRPAVSATTAGIGNPIVSLLEDIGVVLLVVLLIFAPVVGFALFLALVLLIWRMFRKVLRFFRRGRRAPAKVAATPAGRGGVVDADVVPGRAARKRKAASAGGAVAKGAGAAALGAAAMAARGHGQQAQPVAGAHAQTPLVNTPGATGATPTPNAPTTATTSYGPGAAPVPILPLPHTMNTLPQTQPMPGQGGQATQPSALYPPDATTLPGTTP